MADTTLAATGGASLPTVAPSVDAGGPADGLTAPASTLPMCLLSTSSEPIICDGGCGLKACHHYGGHS